MDFYIKTVEFLCILVNIVNKSAVCEYNIFTFHKSY